MSQANFFSRSFYQDLLKITISFFLITGLGSLTAHYWQKKEYQFQNLSEQKKYEKEAASKIFEKNSSLMDKFTLSFQLLNQGIGDKNCCMKSYIHWKENYSGNKALVAKYFGNSALNSFVSIDTKINQLFNEIDFKSDTNMSVNSQTFLNQLEIDIYNYNSQLIDDLLSNNIGSFAFSH